MSMPHLSQLQRDYKNKHVTIIGLTSEDSANSLAKVKEMVQTQGDRMDYTVAWDVERKTNEAYMEAANAPGLPTSFLIDQTGTIAWIGHPLQADIPLAMVVDGTWDYEKGPALMEQIDSDLEAVYQTAGKDPKRALELLVRFRADYPLADKDLEELHFAILTRLPEQAEEAAALGRQIVDKAIAEKSAQALNAFAWQLVDPGAHLENRFLELARLAADKANAFSEEKDPSILDTVARVHFWLGDLERALAVQKQAVEHAEGRMEEALKETFEEYQKALEAKSSS